MKKCAGKCGLWLDEVKFWKRAASPDGRQSRCIKCSRTYSPTVVGKVDRSLSVIIKDEITINAINRSIEEKKQKFAPGIRVTESQFSKFITQTPPSSKCS